MTNTEHDIYIMYYSTIIHMLNYHFDTVNHEQFEIVLCWFKHHKYLKWNFILNKKHASVYILKRVVNNDNCGQLVSRYGNISQFLNICGQNIKTRENAFIISITKPEYETRDMANTVTMQLIQATNVFYLFYLFPR